MSLFCDVHAGTSCLCVCVCVCVCALFSFRRRWCSARFSCFQKKSFFYGSVRVHILLYEPPKYNFCRRSITTLHIGHRRNRLQHFLHVHAWPHGINTAWTERLDTRRLGEFFTLALRMREACGSSRSATSAPSFASSASSSPSPSPPSSSPLSEADINP